MNGDIPAPNEALERIRAALPVPAHESTAEFLDDLETRGIIPWKGHKICLIDVINVFRPAGVGSPPSPETAPTFFEELTQLINRHSLENGSDTPDFILAGYLIDCLNGYHAANRIRDKWYNDGASAASVGLSIAMNQGPPQPTPGGHFTEMLPSPISNFAAGA